MKPQTYFLTHWRQTGLILLLTMLTIPASRVLAQSAYTWNGGSGATGNWSDGANWGGSGPANAQAFLNFNGATRTSNTNDLASGGPGYQIYFKSGANAFNLYGNAIFFYDYGGADPNIQNEGASTNQTISFPVANGNNNGTYHILNINVNTGTSQGPLTFNGTVKSADANQPLRVINIYGPSAIAFNGIISDFDGTHLLAISQLGSGTTTLTASNTFTGDMTVNAGTLVLATNNALANGANFIRLGDTAGSTGANLNLNGGNNLSTSINVRSGSSGGKIIANTAGTPGNAAFLGNLYLDADVTLFANSTGGNTLSGSTLDLKNQTLTIDGTGSNVISGALQNSTGTGKLVKNNTGTLYLSGAGSYAGGTTINSGIVQVNSSGAFGTGNVTMNTSANQTKILLNGVIITNNMTLNSTNPGAAQGVLQALDNTSSTNSGIVTFNTNTVSGGNLYGPITSGLLTMAGAINVNSPGTIILVRDGKLRFSGGGSYLNMDVRSGNSSLGANNGLSATALVDIGGNASTTVPGVLDLNGFNQTLAGLKNAVTPANLAWVTNSSVTASTLTLSNSAVQVFNGSVVGNLALTVVNGTQIISNAVTAGNGVFAYTGDTTISGGTLKTAAANLLPNSTGKGNLIVTNTGTLDLNTFSQTVNGLSGNGTVDTVAGGTPTLTVGSNNASSSFGGYLKNSAGTLALTKFGTGTLILSGTNTHNGVTTVATGSTVQYQGASAMSTNSTLTLQNTAVVQLRADANTTFTNGTLNPAGGATVTFDVNQLTGVGANNVLTLASTNTAGYTVGGNSVTMTFNVTGGNGDSLTLPGNANFSGNNNNGFMLVPTTANVNLTGNVNGSSGNSGQVLTLDGTSTSNTISGVISGSGGLSLMKQNTSTWYLFGANTFPGDTRIVGGTLTLANTLALQSSSVNLSNIDSGTLNVNNLNATLGGLKGARNLALGTGTISIGNNNAANTYSGALSGNAVTKIGTGIWTLTGNSIHNGTTTISAGELIGQTGGSVSNSTISVSSGATNGVLLAAAGGQFACGGLTFSSGTTYADFNLNNLAPSTTTAPLQVNGNLAFTVTPNVILRSAGATIAPGTYPLIKYTGTLSGTPPSTLLAMPVGLTATIVNNTGNKSIDLNVTVGNAVSWAVGNATWDINTTANWKNTSSSAVNYLDGEAVVLDDTASGATPISITLGASVTPLSITANVTNKNYTIVSNGFAILGSGPLTKNGTGTLTIGSTNLGYAGAITLNAGTLAMSAGSSLGTAVVTFSNNATFSIGSGSAGLAPGNAINVAPGATATLTANTLSSGPGGNINSTDATGSIIDTASITYAGVLTGFSGTFTVSGGTTRFSNGSTGASLGSAAANFVINSTSPGLQPRNNGTTMNLGSLSGSGTLASSQSPTAANTTTYSIGALNTSTTFSGKFTESGVPGTNCAVTKIGSGTFTVSGASPHTGATTVSAGALIGVTGGSFSNSAVTVSAGATNGVSVTVVGSSWVCTNLTYATGSYALFAFGANTPSTTVAPLLIQNGLTISGTLNVIVTGGSTTIPVGTYPLIKYTNTLSGTVPAVPFSLPSYVSGILTNDTANKLIALIVTNVITPTLTWSAGMGTWETNSINWTNNLLGGLTNWSDGNVAQFDDTAVGAGPFTVTLTNNVNPLGVLFTNNTKNYTLNGNGSVIGSGTLTKAGSGTLVLATTNSFSGGIAVVGGVLQGSSGTLLSNIINSAALVFDQSVNGSNNAVISGSGSLTKQNSGTLALGGNNSYTGPTFINAGTLAISAGSNLGGNPGSAITNQITINGSTLLATNGAATITLPTNAGLLVTNTATIDVASGITLDYPAQGISGTGALVKNGAGTFETDEGTANSTYSNLTINAGTFAFNKSSSGLGVGSLIINGGVIRTASTTARTPNNPNIFVNADFTLGSPTSTNISFSNGGTWTLANGTRTITVDTITATITGVVGDGGNNYGLTKAGSGTLILSVADTYTGPTTISAGYLKLANNLAAGTNSITATGLLQIANGVTVANAFTANQTFESLDVPDASAIGTYSGVVSCPSTAQFRFSASGAGAVLVLSNATVNLGARFIYPTRGNIVYAGNSAISSSSGSLIGRSAGVAASLVMKDNAAANFTGGFAMGNGGGINSSVAFTLQDSASLTTGTSGFDFLGTTIASSSVSLNGGTLAVGALFKTAATAETLSLNGGVIKANTSSVSFFPALSGLTANVSTGGAVFNDSGFTITIAQPLLHDSALGATADGGLTKSGTGITTLSGTNSYTGATTVNAGTLLVTGITGTNIVTVNTNATLSGTGTLNGATTVALGGTLQAGLGGADTSTLVISNSLTLGGKTIFNLNRTNAQTANKVAGLTTVNYGGALTVTNVGNALQVGDTFSLFAAAGYSGSFATTTLPSLNAGLAWNTSQLAVNGTIQVASVAAVTVSPASTNLVYGNSAVLTANATGSTPLTYQWYDNNTNLISGATNATLALNVPAVSATGNYSVVVTNAYGRATNLAAVTVTPALLSVTANDTNRVYGAADPAFTAAYSGFVNSETASVISGSPSLTTTTSNTSPVGTYTITAAVGSLTAANYSFVAFTNGTMTVNPAALGITANSTSKTYGQTVTFAGTEFTTSGLVAGDSVTSVSLASTGATNTATVGGYPIIPSAATGGGLGNYNITYNNGTLTVNNAALGITANSSSKTYGQTVTFAGTEFTASGLVGSDSVTGVTLTSAGATNTAAAGGFTIVPSAATGGGLSNYSISYTNGTLTVNPLAVVLGGTRVYDGTTNASNSILSVTNIIGSDDVNVASGTGGLAGANVGAQAITSFGTLALGGTTAGNYTLAGASGSVTITAAGSSLALVSSANPAGYLDALTFTASVAPTNATGSVTFYSGATPFSTNSLVVGVAGSVSLTSLARGTNTITAIYGGDADYNGSTNSLAQVVTNHPPVAGNIGFALGGGVVTLRINTSDLLTNVTDADGDTITLVSAGNSTNGITPVVGGGLVQYYNPVGVADQFTYTVTDGFGGTNTGSISITVTNVFVGQITGQFTSFTGGVANLSFFGIPNYSYITERSTNLASWVDIQTNTAATNGLINIIDAFGDLGGVPPTSAYYRLKY